MLGKVLKADVQGARKDILVLFAASVACVGAVAAGLAWRLDPAGVLSAAPPAALVMAGLTAAVLAAVATWKVSRRDQTGLAPFSAEGAEARWKLAAADALVGAEPQIVILWEKDRPMRVAAHSLDSVPGVPADLAGLMRFTKWLEPASAKAIRAGLDALLADGKPFSLILRTAAGGHLESDGRAAGGRAMMRLRDMAGHKRDLLDIIDRHQRVARDARASRALLEALPFPVWMKDTAAERLTWVNGAYVKAVEAASEAEAIERQIELLDTRQRQSVDRALARGQNYRKRVQLSAGGERRAHDILVLPLDGAAVAAAIDLGAAEAAQKGAAPAQAYDRTLDRVATAVAIVDASQKLAFFNEAFVKLWRLDAPWLESGPGIGAVLDRLRDLGRLPEVANWREWKAKTLSSCQSGAEGEEWWHLPDGRIVRVMVEPRADGGTTFLYVDETERLSLESRFNALITVQRETLNSLKEGVAVFATDGRLELRNSAFESIWRLDPAALDQSPHIDDIIRQCRAGFDDPVVWTRIREAVTSFSERRGNIEGQITRPDASVIDYAATPLPDGALLLTFSDVTASKKYERALIERSEALELADRLKTQFIGHVSHELRTPLTNVIGFSELLASPRAGPLNVKQREYLSDIASSSKALLAAIDDIIDIATIDAGVLELNPRRVEVRNVIEAAIQGVRERAARARLTLDIGIADDAIAFHADEARVRQVLYHLLSNAIGFSAAGKVVHLTCWREGGKMIFSVEDDGVGIPKDQQSLVFERFESRSHGSKHRGAGLGLSIVKSVVELHGGDMELTSESGRGTRVTVRFPEHAAKVSSLVAEKPARAPRARSAGAAVA